MKKAIVTDIKAVKVDKAIFSKLFRTNTDATFTTRIHVYS